MFVPVVFFILCGALLSYLSVMAGPVDIISGMEALAIHMGIGGISIVAVNVVYLRCAGGLSKLLQAFPRLPKKAFGKETSFAISNL